MFKGMQERYQNALKTFYPSIPNPLIPASLPLENHTGVYSNPGYHNVTLTMKEHHLFLNGSEHSFNYGIDLEHVSGDHFMG